MNTAATILKAPDRAEGGDDPFLPRPDGPGSSGHGARRSAGSIALWVFMAVASALFLLFIAAYIMRMDASDWAQIGMPRQLWLSTALLVAGSVLMQLAAMHGKAARGLMIGGGICALAFISVQLWAWEAMLDMRVMPAGNPSASFFYLLTAMHALHVAGGLVAWGWTAHAAIRASDAEARRRIGLCARYWHFLLAVWLVLYATFTGLTPDVVAFICGR